MPYLFEEIYGIIKNQFKNILGENQTMVLMLLVVLCYTITSLNDKYAVTKAGMNGSQMTFIMAAATATELFSLRRFRSCS